jgi:uncharacterized protein (DUF2141 family)
MTSIFSADIKVDITNIFSKEGRVIIGLYDDINTSNFGNLKSIYKGVMANIKDDLSTTYTFKDIPNGVYSIAVFHDINNNIIFDKGFANFPLEGYGFSNDISPHNRQATFSESSFVLNEYKSVFIKMNNATVENTVKANDINITIDSIENGYGTIYMGLYKKAPIVQKVVVAPSIYRDFPTPNLGSTLIKEEAKVDGIENLGMIYKSAVSKINEDNKTSNYVFKNIPNGEYAIGIYHDVNNNQKQDLDVFNAPIEEYCFSNNIRPLYESPVFEEVKFSLFGDKNISVSMVHSSAINITPANNLSVVVDGIRNFNGRISIGLFKQGEGENLERAEDVYKGTRVQINEFAQAKFVFYNIPNGNYALSVLHDENSNNVMDKGFFGIPLEGYAFSNNVKPLMRSATFNEARFSIYNVDKNISIHISY